jgi:hypothetical protein
VLYMHKFDEVFFFVEPNGCIHFVQFLFYVYIMVESTAVNISSKFNA